MKKGGNITSNKGKLSTLLKYIVNNNEIFQYDTSIAPLDAPIM